VHVERVPVHMPHPRGPVLVPHHPHGPVLVPHHPHEPVLVPMHPHEHERYLSPHRVPCEPAPVMCVHPHPHPEMQIHHEPVRRSMGTSPSRHTPARKPILHMPEEDQFISCLKEMCNLEQEMEQAKTSLVNRSDYNLPDAFSIFDPSRRGVIGVNDIREGLSAIGVYPTGEEIELFVTRYDKNCDRRLNFNEFAEAFCPLDGYYAHMLNKRQSNGRGPLYRRDDCFFQDTQLEYRNVWRVHFKVEVSIEAIR
jgi:hypothetical protein